MLIFALGSGKLYLTHENLKKAFGNIAMGLLSSLSLKHGETFVQHCKFLSHPFTGPTDENVGKVHTIIIKGWWSTILYQADRFVPWLITSKQKQPQFLSAEAWLLCCAICTCLIFTLVISSCFGKWNCSYEGMVFRMSLKFRNSPWPSYMWYQKDPVVLPAMAEMPDTLCKSKRRYFEGDSRNQ